METYIGTKILEATPLNRREYNRYRGWVMPTNENGDDLGYLVRYPDGYESWSPKETFEESYRREGEMNFGHALEILNRGGAVARTGWNGLGMFLYLVPAPATGYPAQTGVAKAFFGEEALVPYTAYVAIKSVNGTVTPWAPSQTDMLAQDWTMVSFDK
jgi:hypothetical protein